MIRYRADYPNPEPHPVECAVRGWPHPDAAGETQYENSHFDTAKECSEKLLADAEAGVSLDAGRVRECRDRLAAAEKRLVDSAIALDAIKTSAAKT